MIYLLPNCPFSDRAKKNLEWRPIPKNFLEPRFPEVASWYETDQGEPIVILWALGKYGVIPGTKDLSKETISYESWKLEKIFDKPNPGYTLNKIQKCSADWLGDGFSLTEGDWTLINDRIGYRSEFTVRKLDSWTTRWYIGVPGKLEYPMNRTEIIKTEKFLLTLIYGLRN